LALSGLKPFYAILIAIALIGGGAIVFSQGSKPSGPTSLAPVLGADTSVMPGYVIGSDSAPIEVQEYGDFQCPFCRTFYLVTMPDITERLIRTGKIRWRFKDRPLEGHPKSLPAHQAGACAGEQGRFWEMLDQLYTHQNDWVEARNTPKKIREYAQKIGLDVAKYDQCVDSNKYLSRLVAEARRDTDRGINATPTFVVGNTKIEGTTYDEIKRAVDRLSPNPKL
jgi:protein-disulfide isomerase